MTRPLRTYILAYPDNPISWIFLDTFLKNGIHVKGIIIEEKKSKKNWHRLRKKVHKDGLLTAFRRMFQIYIMKIQKKTVVHLAEQKSIDVYRINKFNSKKCSEILDTLDIDLFAIASAPILKEYIFTKAKKGCLNAHPGWLPEYRGLGANAYALQNGDSPGITVHYIDAGIDTGSIILREKMSILKNDTVAKINDRAVAKGADLMVKVIKEIENNNLVMAKINEPMGEMYYSMPFTEVKILNRKLKNQEFINALC